MKPKEIIVNTIMKRAGLTDWELDYVTADVEAILRALKRNGYKIEKKT